MISNRHLRAYRFTGLEGGAAAPRLIVTGAVHGNETAGTKAIRRVLHEIEHGDIEILRGSVSFVPVCNPLAYNHQRRMGDRNLNRRLQPTATPQDFEDRVAGVLCGWLAARLAPAFAALLPRAAASLAASVMALPPARARRAARARAVSRRSMAPFAFDMAMNFSNITVQHHMEKNTSRISTPLTTGSACVTRVMIDRSAGLIAPAASAAKLMRLAATGGTP